MCIEKDQCAICDEKEPNVSIQNEQGRPSGKEGLTGTCKSVDSTTDPNNAANKSPEDTPSEKTPLMSQAEDQKTEEAAGISDLKDSEGEKCGVKDNVEGETEGQETEHDDTKFESKHIKKHEGTDGARSKGEEDLGLVSSITIEEIQLIRKYADPEAVQSIAKHLKLCNPGSIADTDIVNALEKEKDKKRQREKIRELLKKTNARHEELLAEKRDRVTFKADIPRLAMRLLLTDVYPFAQALGYTVHRLSRFQVDHCIAAERKGSNEIIRLLYEEAEKDEKGRMAQPRSALPKLLRKCGYRQIARAYIFDFDVSTSDLMAVAIRIEPDKLAKMLGIHEDSQTRTRNKMEDNIKMLVEWKKMMCPPDCNHRTALADIMHAAEFKDVAFGILTGEYRDCVPCREVLTELARRIPVSEADQLCEVLDIKEEQSDAHNGSDIVELLVTWMEQGKKRNKNKIVQLLEAPTEKEWRKQKDGKLSDKVYEAGFIDLANEILTGIRHGKVTQLMNS